MTTARCGSVAGDSASAGTPQVTAVAANDTPHLMLSFRIPRIDLLLRNCFESTQDYRPGAPAAAKLKEMASTRTGRLCCNSELHADRPRHHRLPQVLGRALRHRAVSPHVA